MNKAALADALVAKFNIPKKQAVEIIEAMTDIIIDQLVKGNEVTLAGFGTFSPKSRHARMGVNPQKPNERIKMPETTVAKFKAGKTLKDALKTKHKAPAQPASEMLPPQPTL